MAMTDDQINALNEQIEKLTNKMDSLVGALNSIIGTTTNAAKATANASTAAGGLTNAVNSSTTAIQNKTKADKEAAERQYSNERAYRSVISAVTGFADALISGERGLKKYGDSLSNASDALSELLTSRFGIGGTIAAGALSGLTILTKKYLEQGDALLKARVELASFAGSITLSTTEIQEMANNMGFTVSQFSETLGKSLRTAQSGLVGLGGTAGEGAKRFAQIGDVLDEDRKKFIRLGVMPEELLESQAEYISQLKSSGSIIFANRKSTEQLQLESLKYAENLRILSEFSGKEVDRLKKEQDAALAETAFQAKKIQMLEEATRLEAAGQTERAEAIKNQVTSMDAAVRDAVGKMGSDGARLVRELFVGQLSPEMMRFVGVLPGGMEAVQKFTTDFEQMDPQLAVSGLMDSLSSSLREQISRIGPELIQVIPEEIRKMLSLTTDTMGLTLTTLSREFDESLGRILTNFETEQRLRAEAAVRGAGGPDENKQVDVLSNTMADLITTEMQVAAGFDSLLASTNPLISGFNTTTLAAAALAASLGMAAAAAGQSAIGNIEGKGGKGSSLGKLGKLAKGIGYGSIGINSLLDVYQGYSEHQDIDARLASNQITQEQANEEKVESKASTVGAGIGSIALGGLGMVLGGPVGAMIGSTIGSQVGETLGQLVGERINANATTPTALSVDTATPTGEELARAASERARMQEEEQRVALAAVTQNSSTTPDRQEEVSLLFMMDQKLSDMIRELRENNSVQEKIWKNMA